MKADHRTQVSRGGGVQTGGVRTQWIMMGAIGSLAMGMLWWPDGGDPIVFKNTSTDVIDVWSFVIISYIPLIYSSYITMSDQK